MVSLSIMVIIAVVYEYSWIRVSQSVFQLPPQIKLFISLLSGAAHAFRRGTGSVNCLLVAPLEMCPQCGSTISDTRPVPVVDDAYLYLHGPY